MIVYGIVNHGGISDPERCFMACSHKLSSSMAQRVMIAMAFIPELLIADEPTTALDVTVQAQILDLMRDLRSKLSTAINHARSGRVAEMTDRIAIMYAG